jgi:hypothetical protein
MEFLEKYMHYLYSSAREYLQNRLNITRIYNIILLGYDNEDTTSSLLLQKKTW